MRCTSVGIERLLYPENEKAVVQVLSIENLVNRILNNDGTKEDRLLNVDNDQDDGHDLLPSLMEQRQVLAAFLQFLEQRGVSGAGMRRVMLSCQCTLRSEQVASLAQRNLWTFFE